VVWLRYSDGLLPARVLDTLPIDVLCKTKGLPCQVCLSIKQFRFGEVISMIDA